LPMLASSCPGMRLWFVLWLHFSAVFTVQWNRIGFCCVCGQICWWPTDSYSGNGKTLQCKFWQCIMCCLMWRLG
jgi:hypothetical protein